MSKAADRRYPRHEVSLRVRSRQLPGFQAITLDLSRSGCQLETEKPLKVGSTLELDFEFDQEELPNFRCQALVVSAEADPDRRNRATAGLTFLPRTPQEQTDLARMATVIGARSQADLEDLLEEAKRLDPERSDIFQRVGRHARPSDQDQQPEQAVGVFIPLRVVVEEYQFFRIGRCLILTFTELGHRYQLKFPQCQRVLDHGCLGGEEAIGLFVTTCSQWLREVQQHHPGPWKHYRLVAEHHRPLLEILSAPCEPDP